MGRLNGRVAIITGGARGQGEAMARLFVDEGARVVIADVLIEKGQAVARDLGADAEFVRLDVTREQDWHDAVARAVGTYGRLDVLVNNAGILHIAALLQTTTDDYRRVVEVNQTGVFLGMRTAAPAIEPGGSIVNISSVEGLAGTAGAFAYVASKFAVRGMTKAAALELAPLGIRVNSIHPGAVQTPMLDNPALAGTGIIEDVIAGIPLNRIAEPLEVAALAAYLASNDSSYSTGSEFVVDGGVTAKV